MLGKDWKMFEEMLGGLKGFMRTALADKELFTLTAQMLKKAHVALTEAGFTEEQATLIVANQGTGFSAK